MFNPSKNEVRQFFCDVYRKAQAKQAMSALEILASEWIAEHPEYHTVLSDVLLAQQEEYTPERGETNPFMHLAMHLSISEQTSIDQPKGIRAACETLSARLNSLHQAQHKMMECLGKTLHDAQLHNQAPDGDAYIDCILKSAF